MKLYTPEECALLREGGAQLAEILHTLKKDVAPGVTGDALEARARELIKATGGTPAFLGYRPSGASRPYPAALCLSINDEAVHGIPHEQKKILKEGDSVTLDTGLLYKGYITDSAITVQVGRIDEEKQHLIATTERALAAGIAAARSGHTTGDIGAAIEAVVKKAGLTVIEELGGHGVGRSVHEDPFVPNFGTKGSGTPLREGMVLALEPIITTGSGDVFLAADGYTLCTKDAAPVAQFEHTILITDGEPEILTFYKKVI